MPRFGALSLTIRKFPEGFRMLPIPNLFLLTGFIEVMRGAKRYCLKIWSFLRKNTLLSLNFLPQSRNIWSTPRRLQRSLDLTGLISIWAVPIGELRNRAPEPRL